MMQNLMQKIYKLQKDITPIKKTETNPFFKSKYFDINILLKDLKPLFEAHKLVVLQPLSFIGEVPSIRTMITDLESGESMTSEVPLPMYETAQEMGSAITYTRRYSLQALLCLEAEDDDGNLATYPKGKEAGKATYTKRTFTRRDK